MRRTTTMVVLAVLMLVLTATVAVSATPEGNAKAKPRVELSTQQRAQFVAGAKKVAGLNAEQINAAFGDPATFAAVPVRADVLPLETEPTASAQNQGGESSLSAAASSYCQRIGSTVNYFNTYRTLLASYKVSRVWCWNYSAITYVSVPAVSGTVTQKGAALGWRYNGVIAKSDYYFYYDGLSRGGHISNRKGSFSVCNAAYGCYLQKTPRATIYGYYNGRGYQISRA